MIELTSVPIGMLLIVDLMLTEYNTAMLLTVTYTDNMRNLDSNTRLFIFSICIKAFLSQYVVRKMYSV